MEVTLFIYVTGLCVCEINEKRCQVLQIFCGKHILWATIVYFKLCVYFAKSDHIIYYSNWDIF